MQKHSFAAIGFFGLAAAGIIGSLVQAQNDRLIIEWPSRTNPTLSLQDVIDAAPNDAVIRIGPGIHELAEALWIRNTRLTFIGSGRDGARRTELVRPVPGSRDPIPEADLAVGVFNFIDSDGGVENLATRGSDVGIVGRATAAPPRGVFTMNVKNVTIGFTGRGILWRSKGKIKVSDSKITDVAWNGISLAPQGTSSLGSLLKVDLASIDIFDFGNAGVVYIDDPGVCDNDHTVKDATIIGGGGPGILAIRSGVCVDNTHIALTRGAGILAISAAVLVEHSKFFFPLPLPDGRFGSGIVAAAAPSGRSVVTVFDNEIKNVEHSYISNYGSDVTFIANEMVCSDAFDLEGEQWLGFPFTFNGSPLQCSDACPAQLGLPPPSFKECEAIGAGTGPPGVATPIP